MEDEEKTKEMEETKEIVKEEIKEEIKEPKKNNSNKIIIILSIVIVILVILLLVVLLGGNKKEEKKEEDNETEEKEDISDKDIGITDLKSKNGLLLFNKYVVDYEKGKITDLDGKLLTEVNDKWHLEEGINNSIVLVNHNPNDNSTTIKRVLNDSVSEYNYDYIASLIRDTKSNRIIGILDSKKDHDELLIFTDKENDSIDLKNKFFYTFALGAGEDMKVYDGRYIVTSTTSSKLSAHGLYDIKDKKVLIENEYTGIEHLHDDIFVAIKDDYSGVIDKNNKVLLDFDYDSIQYSNGLYFAAKDTTLDILDSNFKSLNSSVEISSLKSFTYNPCCGSINPYKLIKFKDYVILGTKEDNREADNYYYNYYAVDKSGNKTELGNGDATVVKNYLVTSKKDDTKITVYDDKLAEKYVLTANQKGTYLKNATIFLDRVLSLEGLKFYNFPDGKEKSSVSPIRRTSQEYEVKIDFKDGKGTATISKDEQVLATIEDVSIDAFLAAENNGIIITKTHFIFNPGHTLVIIKK